MKVANRKDNTWDTNLRIILANLRIIPRGLVIAYLWAGWEIATWFMALAEPSTQHAAFVSVYAGIFPAVLGLYANTGNSKQEV